MTIALGATGAATNRLNVGASALAPGDTVQRSVDLTNSGSIDLSGVTLTTTASPSSLLAPTRRTACRWSSTTSVAWTEAGPPYT